MLETLNRAWRIVATGFCFSVFGLGGIVLGLAVCPVAMLFVRGAARQQQLSQTIIHYCFRGFVGLMNTVGVISYEVHGAERLQRRGLLVLANHPSLIDVVLLLIIFAFLKRGLMSVKYSLLWLALAVGLVIAAAFPYVVYVLRDLLDIEMPVNLVFLLMFCFVLVVLLSLSIAISQLADKCKRLTQANAMLEKRVRDLEEKK